MVENYKPNIEIKNEWELVKLGEMCNLLTG